MTFDLCSDSKLISLSQLKFFNIDGYLIQNRIVFMTSHICFCNQVVWTKGSKVKQNARTIAIYFELIASLLWESIVYCPIKYLEYLEMPLVYYYRGSIL